MVGHEGTGERGGFRRIGAGQFSAPPGDCALRHAGGLRRLAADGAVQGRPVRRQQRATSPKRRRRRRLKASRRPSTARRNRRQRSHHRQHRLSELRHRPPADRTITFHTPGSAADRQPDGHASRRNHHHSPRMQPVLLRTGGEIRLLRKRAARTERQGGLDHPASDGHRGRRRQEHAEDRKGARGGECAMRARPQAISPR